MAVVSAPDLYRRPYAEVRALLLERARYGRNPDKFVPLERARAIFDRLDTLDRDRWAGIFSAAADPPVAAATRAEARREAKTARRECRAAYGLFRVARYPAPNSPAKKLAYRRSQEAFLKGAAFLNQLSSASRFPISARQAPGRSIVAYLMGHGPELSPTIVTFITRELSRT